MPRRLSINDADEERNMFYNEIKRAKHGRITDQKITKENLLNEMRQNLIFVVSIKIIY